MGLVSLVWSIAKLPWSLTKLLWGLGRLLWFAARIIIKICLVLGNLALSWRGRNVTNRTPVQIRRDWNDHRIGTVEWSQLRSPHWDNISGGEQNRTPQPFIHGFVWCDEVQGDIAHSCIHGPPPHDIKVCLVKKDNSKEVWIRLSEIVGGKPNRSRFAGRP